MKKLLTLLLAAGIMLADTSVQAASPKGISIGRTVKLALVTSIVTVSAISSVTVLPALGVAAALYWSRLQPTVTTPDYSHLSPADKAVVDVLQNQGLSSYDIDDMIGVINHFRYKKSNQTHNPGGVLISGPPGTGKSRVVKSLVRAAGCALLEATPATLSDARTTHAFFEEARSKGQQQCQGLFVDEMDHVCGENSPALNQFLIESVRSEPGNRNLLLLGPTNFPDAIAPAAQRAGRMDYHLRVKLPNLAARIRIFNEELDLYSKNFTKTYDITGEDIAEAGELTSGLAAADIESIVRRAFLNTEHTEPVSRNTFMHAVDQVIRKVITTSET